MLKKIIVEIEIPKNRLLDTSFVRIEDVILNDSGREEVDELGKYYMITTEINEDDIIYRQYKVNNDGLACFNVNPNIKINRRY